MNMRIMILAVLTSCALACRAVTQPFTLGPTAVPILRSTPTILHFDNEWVAFDYPDHLKLFDSQESTFAWYPDIDFGGNVVVGLGDPRFYHFEEYFRWIRITRRPFLVEQDVAKTVQQMYLPLEDKHPHPGTLIDAPESVTINGLAAYEKRYRIYGGEPVYDLRDIWVVKDAALYVISSGSEWTNPDDVDAFNTHFEALLRSLVIK